MSKKISGALTIIIVMLGALFTWSLYKLIYTGTGDALMSLGITNDYWQNGLIIIGTGALLVLIGKKNLMQYLK